MVVGIGHDFLEPAGISRGNEAGAGEENGFWSLQHAQLVDRRNNLNRARP
jgi:hypothetical protein